MCGIAGAVAVRESANWSRSRLNSCVARMAAAIGHRGPDDQGIWVSPDHDIALAHRRLSIVDLSARGHQPMTYGSRFTTVFNGEIYNFRELRRELSVRGHAFRSDTDTEVLMAAVLEWGIEAALRAFVGMFSFALWDAQERVLHLARDRLGEKPLYIGGFDGYLFFGSELRAIESVPGIDLTLSAEALGQYLRHGYVPAPWTPWKVASKLPQASLLSLRTRVPHEPQIKQYWNPKASVQASSAETAVSSLERLLDESVRLQMQCDVPMGAFLSGGIDSTAVVASMQAQAATPVSTFTVKFDVPGFDESEHAAAIARHLGTNHHEIAITTDDILNTLPREAERLDEPTANASYFPLYTMAQAARRHVKVIMTGDGGDELFGGYNRYRLTPTFWRRIRWIPYAGRSLLADMLRQASPGLIDRIAVISRRSGLSGQTSTAIAARKLARVLQSRSLAESYERLLECWDEPRSILCVPTTINGRHFTCTQDGFLRAASLYDLEHYLPDDNLAKSDRATMLSGLEARAPLLDHRIVEFACGLNDSLRIRDGVSKWILRQVAYRRVPHALLERPKMGFTVPVAAWLRGPLLDWADGMLSAPALYENGLICRDAVKENWHNFQKRDEPIAWQIWALVMLAAWLKGRSSVGPAASASE